MIDILKDRLISFAGMTLDEVSVSLPYWQNRTIPKGDFYNKQNVVCKDLGIVVKGIFRFYHYDPETGEEKNMFFFSQGQFIVSFGSFIYQHPCRYYIEALEDAEIIYIPYNYLQNIYSSHGAWQRFGRILAEHFFIQSQRRAEELLFLTHEERYVNLLAEHPEIVSRIPAFHIASYLGIKNQSLSRIRKRIADKQQQ
ncbi:Crp/Fnr family transcriptional regulator [Flavobacterium silvaticum]|nr:Crp/Fnr family transcriptional regulator [Flavobacterium silvaticum]